MQLPDHVLVIARWTDMNDRAITIQNFVMNGRSFVPFFLDEEHFRAETKGSGYEDQGVSIDRRILASMLSGDELLILNPGSEQRQITKADLEAD